MEKKVKEGVRLGEAMKRWCETGEMRKRKREEDEVKGEIRGKKAPEVGVGTGEEERVERREEEETNNKGGPTKTGREYWSVEEEVEEEGWNTDRERIEGGDLPEGCEEEHPEEFMVVLWNACGEGEEKKWGQIVGTVKRVRPTVVMINELKSVKEEDLALRFPGYYWFAAYGTNASKGVAIGLRGGCGITFPIKPPISDWGGCYIGLDIRKEGAKFRVSTIYRHTNTSVEILARNLKKLLHPTSWNVIGGDLNLDPKGGKWGTIEKVMGDAEMTRLSWDLATHWNGRCIDHLFMSSPLLKSNPPVIGCTPTIMKDHGIMVGGVTRKHFNQGPKTRRFPESLLKNKKFQKEVKERLTAYQKGQGKKTLQQFREVLCQRAEEFYKEEGGMARDFKRLRDVMLGIRTIRERGLVPPKVSTSSEIMIEIIREGMKKRKLKKKRGWRRAFSPWILKDAKEKACDLAEVLGVAPPFGKEGNWAGATLRRSNNSNLVGGIKKEGGVVVTDPKEMAEEMMAFWEKLFSAVREVDDVTLKEMLANHPIIIPEIERHEVDLEIVDKLIARTNKTTPGPDGIPFLAYKIFAEELREAWAETIQEAGEDCEWEASFGETNLILLPKVEGFPKVDQFRPISITNAEYRIVTRYWAVWFAKIPGVLSENQAAIIQGRVIDDAVELVADELWERIASGKRAILLQTDFQKAYDFVNRNTIIAVLEKVKAPRQIINLCKKIYQDSEMVYSAGGNDYSFQGRTGVRQGCPISPLIFCIVFDLLVVKISESKVTSATAAYVDDLATVIQETQDLVKLEEFFDEYSAATGAQLNFEKCFLLSTQKDMELSGRWKEMPKKNYCSARTIHLGVPVSIDVDPDRDWESTVQKFEGVCRRINKMRATTTDRIKMLNMYAMPVLEYVGRFRLMTKKIAKRVWTAMRRAMAGKWSIPLKFFMSGKRLVSSSTRLRHPVLRNWAMLAAREPMRETYRNPFSVGYAKKTAKKLVKEVFKKRGIVMGEEKRTAATLYKLLESEIPTIDWCEAMKKKWNCGGYRTVLHNANYAIGEDLKRNLFLLMCGGWALKTQLSRQRKGVGRKCRLCQDKEEGYLHILTECEGSEMMKRGWNTAIRETGKEEINFEEDAWGLAKGDQGKEGTRLRLIALKLLRGALIKAGKGKKISSKESKKEMMEQMKGRVVAKGGSKKRDKKLVAPPEGIKNMMYYDGSGREDNQQGGSGSVVFVDGEEKGNVALTIPYGTNNIGEFTAALKGMQLALRQGIKHLAVVGDCKILTEMMRNKRCSKNAALEIIRSKISEVAKGFESLEYYHVTREFNKRADAIAFAAAMSKEAGEMSCREPEWDPRTDEGVKLDSGEEVRKKKGKIWEDIEREWREDYIFPIPGGFFTPWLGDEVVNTSWIFFPHVRTVIGRRMEEPLLAKRVESGMEVIEHFEWKDDVMVENPDYKERLIKAFAVARGVVGPDKTYKFLKGDRKRTPTNRQSPYNESERQKTRTTKGVPGAGVWYQKKVKSEDELKESRKRKKGREEEMEEKTPVYEEEWSKISGIARFRSGRKEAVVEGRGKPGPKKRPRRVEEVVNPTKFTSITGDPTKARAEKKRKRAEEKEKREANKRKRLERRGNPTEEQVRIRTFFSNREVGWEERIDPEPPPDQLTPSIEG